jgi:hypothetical protein
MLLQSSQTPYKFMCVPLPVYSTTTSHALLENELVCVSQAVLSTTTTSQPENISGALIKIKFDSFRTYIQCPRMLFQTFQTPAILSMTHYQFCVANTSQAETTTSQA